MNKFSNEHPMVSIIMPVYNSEKYLSDALNSISKQIYTNFEVILVNDGSTDGSGKILDDFAKQDERVKVIHVSNGGPSSARNIGIAQACGEWIQFMDSDDIIDENMLIELLKATKNADMVVSGAIQESADGSNSVVRSIIPAELNNIDDIGNYISNMDCNTYDLFMNYLWNRLIKRSVLVDFNIRFDENMRLGEDFLFMCELLKHVNKINVINQTYYHYINRGQQSLTHIFIKDEYMRRKIVFNALCNIMEYFGIYEKKKDFIFETEGRFCWLALKRLTYANDDVRLSDKLSYIRTLSGKENIKYMLCYLKSVKSVKSYIQQILIRLHNPILIYFFICR